MEADRRNIVSMALQGLHTALGLVVPHLQIGKKEGKNIKFSRGSRLPQEGVVCLDKLVI